jgi:hypothetical protein
MSNEFNQWGVQFKYPDNWELQEEAAEGIHAVTLNCPEGGFWTLSIYDGQIDIEKIVETALEAIKQEYEGVESERSELNYDDTIVAAAEARFYCLDLTNTVCVRAAQSDLATYVVFYQDEDRQFDRNRESFEAVTKSLLGNVRKLNYWDQ